MTANLSLIKVGSNFINFSLERKAKSFHFSDSFIKGLSFPLHRSINNLSLIKVGSHFIDFSLDLGFCLFNLNAKLVQIEKAKAKIQGEINEMTANLDQAQVVNAAMERKAKSFDKTITEMKGLGFPLHC